MSVACSRYAPGTRNRRAIIKRNQTGSNHPRWKGGVAISGGRKKILLPEHPRASSRRYVLNYVLVAEKALGRPLPSRHPVHHVNEDPLDDRPSNLVICEDARYHSYLHARTRVFKAGGNPNVQKFCSNCKQLLNKLDFYRCSRWVDGLSKQCKTCSRTRVKEWRAKKRRAK